MQWHIFECIPVQRDGEGGREKETTGRDTEPESTMWWSLGDPPHTLKAGWAVRG